MKGEIWWTRRASTDAGERRSARADMEGYIHHMGRDQAESGAPAVLCHDPAVGGCGREVARAPVHGLFDRLTAPRPQARSHRFGRPILERLGFADAS